MALREKLLYAIGIEVDGAKRSLKDIRKSVLEAEGTFGKFKAGGGAAFASIQQNAGLAALAVGGTLVAAGTKAVSVFQETALAAGKFSDATGLAVEDASRWQEVVGDLGGNADAAAGTFVKLEKAIATNSPAVKTLGIELQRTADGNVDINATMLDVIRRLGDIEDPAQKAALAAQLFGKNFADSAEIVLGNADDIEARLKGVSKQQVISEAQLARARKFRDQMDDLSDSLKQVELTVGDQLVPVIGELAEGLVLAEKAAVKLNDVLGNLPGDISLGGINRGQLGAFGIFVRAAKEVKDRFDDGGDSVEVFAGQVDRMADSVNAAAPDLGELSDEAKAAADAAAEAAEHAASLGDKAANSGPKIGDMAGALDDAREHLADLNEEARDNALGILADAAGAVGEALDSAFGDFDEDLDVLDQLDRIADDFDRVAETAKEAQEGGAKGARDHAKAVRDLRRDIGHYLEDLDGIPPDKKTDILLAIRNADVDQLKTILDDLTKDRFINITPVVLHDAFHSVNASFTPGSAPSAPTFSGVSSAPNQPVSTDARTIINYFPVGSTPTTQYVDQQIDQRRNGPY